MSTITERLESATESIENNSYLFNTIVNGTSSQTVTTAGGPVRTIARVIGEAVNTLASSVSGLQETATASALSANEYAASAFAYSLTALNASNNATNSANSALSSAIDASNSASTALIQSLSALNYAASAYSSSLTAVNAASAAFMSQSNAAASESLTFGYYLSASNSASKADNSATTATSAANIVTTLIGELSSNGIVVRIGSNQLIPVTIDGTASQISVTNGDGVAGNPTISITDNPIFHGLAAINGSISASTGIYATTGNVAISSGMIGEIISSSIPSVSSVSLSSTITSDVTSISLTPGNWKISGNVHFIETVATVTAREAGINTVTATLPTDGSEAYNGTQTTTTTTINTISLTDKYITVVSNTPIFISAQITFSAGSCQAFGNITACRIW